MKKASLLLIGFFAMALHALSQVNSYAFTASSGNYMSITGTPAVLIGNGIDDANDEGYANNIPIGFNFNFLGITYNSLSASTNGFAVFGNLTTTGYSNNMLTGIANRPLLAPFWEDIALNAPNDLQYSTSGSAGNRVFVIQWSNVFDDFGATAPSLSFQLRLHETTNVIEFVYSQLPSPVEDFSGGASIGLTSGIPGTSNFLSLNNCSNSPIVSSSIATNTIITRPATGQVYSFTPPTCLAPGGLSVSNITNTAVTFNWTAVQGTNYEYAISASVNPPSSGTNTSAGSVALTALQPGTQYYLHVRSICGGGFSGWSTLSFTTACEISDIPYTMPISNVICPALPLCTTVSDENADGFTWRTYSSGGQGWTDQVVAYVYNSNSTTSANDWLFTPGLNLTAGTYYRLRFKYNNDSTSLYTEKLKVAYGNANTSAAMTNILSNYLSVYSTSPQIATIDFTPSASGVYYIGFQVYSDADKDVLILDDISVDLRPACDAPSSLQVNVPASSISASVSWTPPTYGPPTSYEYAVIQSPTPPTSGITTTSTSGGVGGLTPYAQYYFHVRTGCGSNFSNWTTVPFATVGNDDMCKAIVLTNGVLTCSNNTLATTTATDPPSNCSSPDHTLWYRYTATTTGTIVLRLSTPPAPANPLHGWIGWYEQTGGNCPNMTLAPYGYCAEFGNNGNNDARDIVSPVLEQGVTYFIMIDGYSDDTGEFCLNIPLCPPPVNVNVTNITGSAADINWSGTGSFIVEYGPAGFTPGLGSTAGTGGTIVNSNASPQTITGLTYSTTYDVYVRLTCSASATGYSYNSIRTRFTTRGQPPSNDDCAGAIALTVYDSVCVHATEGTTTNATMSSTTPYPSCGEEPGGYDDDVWYSFTPSVGQSFVNVDFSLLGGYSDITAQIYTSSTNDCNGTFSLYSCSDDGGSDNLPRFVGLRVIPGTTYFVRVFTDTLVVNSQFTICVTKSPPPNDDASGAININVGAGCNGAIFTNETATQSLNEPAGSCSSTRGYATVWYKFNAPPSGAVRISTAQGSGNTLTNTRVALFQVNNPNDYGSGNFTIIACDEDGGSGSFDNMSVLYATGLVVDNTYYIEVDKFDSTTQSGTFCLTIDEISPEMLATTANCNSGYQTPVGAVSSYNGWVSLMDDQSKLIALVRNTNGGPVNGYSFVQNINNGAVRKDAVSGDYYLDRSFTINNPGNPSAILNVQLFFLNSEMEKLKSMDAAASLPNLRITKQTATTCRPDFVAGNGVNNELVQTNYGTGNGVSWLVTSSNNFSNYYIHAVKSYLSAKVFLQGAYSTQLNRHKDVTSAWANVLNTFALKQPYDNSAYVDTAREGYGAITIGGAGQAIVHVTNLNANGPGSLFAAIASNRTIVFDVGGTINNFSWASNGNSITNLTIDGLAAPSPGITLNISNNGDGLSFGQFCHDIIIKGIRVRNAGNDGMNVIGGYNFVFDHVSISGSGDGDLDITDGAHDITVQWSIFGPGKSTWSGAMLIAYPGTKNISLHHNLYTTYGSGVGERNPLVHNATNFQPNPVDYLMADFTNNIVWKWGNANDNGFGYGSGVDYGGTLQCRNNFYQSSLLPFNAIIANHNSSGSQVYATGNVSGNNGVNPNQSTNVALPWSTPSVTTQDACAAASLVVQKAGVRPLDDADLTFINSVSLSNCPSVQNKPPFANAGSNITMVLPANSTTLTGSGSDNDGTVTSYLWTKVDGPSSYNISSPNEPSTVISDLVVGNYKFQLKVTDNNGANGSDTVSVIVVESSGQQPPIANAGNSATLTLPVNATVLSGSATDSDGTVTSYSWTRISGPTTYTIGSPNAASTNLTDLVQGTYVFRLTVTDNNGLTGSDNVTVNVVPSSANNTTSYAGTEKVSPGIFTSSGATTDIIDWVLLEIRNVSGGTITKRAALLREDGQIVDLDGISPVSMYGLKTGANYIIVIRHRNHLSIRTSSLQGFTASALGVTSGFSTYDFTTSQNKAYQNPAITTNPAMKDLGNGSFAMWGGNANGNTTVRASGPVGGGNPTNDLLYLLNVVLGGSTGPGIGPIYHSADVNLDGTVRASGASGGPAPVNDMLLILNVILGGSTGIGYSEHL